MQYLIKLGTTDLLTCLQQFMQQNPLGRTWMPVFANTTEPSNVTTLLYQSAWEEVNPDPVFVDRLYQFVSVSVQFTLTDRNADQQFLNVTTSWSGLPVYMPMLEKVANQLKDAIIQQLEGTCTN